MPFAVTHILVVVICIELFREFFIKNNINFPRYYILIAAIAGILPDFDIALFYILYPLGFTVEQIHRTFMHTIFIPLTLFLIGIIIYKAGIQNKKIRKHHLEISTIFFILTEK